MKQNKLNNLKTGFTTGTCAQAAAKASVIMLTTKKLVNKVEVGIPSGNKLYLKIIDPKIGKDFAQCAVIKDAGDDIDVTHGAEIYAKVRFSKNNLGITITGGKGVGRITKPGLAVPPGEYAINPTPRKMIVKELTPYLPKDNKGVEVIISVPKGEELAKKTFNPRLGIVGGISIIGTSGLVESKSTDAYKTSLSLQLDVLKAQGFKRVTLVLGYVGENFCKEVLKISDDSIVKIGDHVGFMLKECSKKGIRDVLLIGYIGKLVKVANGQFNTHWRFGDNRIETLTHYAKTFGASKRVIGEIKKQKTAEATIHILRKNRLKKVFAKIAEDVVTRVNEFVGGGLHINCILLSLKGEILASHDA
jgi:cobalt-precorrin-5B (C1)-methyltransferase